MIRRRICRASAVAPGTCGELAQGMINGTHFLITCPIDMYSVATVEISHGDGAIRGSGGLAEGLQGGTGYLGIPGETGLEVRLSLDSRLPRGKGMASSTADVPPR